MIALDHGGGLFALGLAQALALLISATFISYVVVIVVPYLRRTPKAPGDGTAFDWHLFVPCRDEEAVIGSTVDYLLGTFPDAHVWVIDDASRDATVAMVEARQADAQSPAVGWRRVVSPLPSQGAPTRPPLRSVDRLHLVSRCLPYAREGKGEALNAAYRALHAWLPDTVDRHSVVVGVIDADGHPAPNCLDVCASDHLFGDAGVGSVQVCVRMANRAERTPYPERGKGANLFARTLVRLQDLEFRAAISAIQLTRQRTRTVGLGGNGQFSRLSALDSVSEGDGRPWHGSLLEDYELSLHLLTAGHRNEYTMDTLVDQEGLPSLRRLLTQRTRWGQGTMQCGSYLPKLWTSRHVSTLGALEASYYLSQPWLQLLGTILYPIPLAVLGWNLAESPGLMGSWLASGGWLLLALYTVLGLGPFVLWGPIYARRCEPGLGMWRALALGLAYSAFITTFYLTSWRAFGRILQGRQGWVKTRRNAETRPGPIAVHT